MPDLTDMQAGGLQRGDEVTFDEGKSFKRVARVSRYPRKGFVLVYFENEIKTYKFADDAPIIAKGDPDGL